MGNCKHYKICGLEALEGGEELCILHSQAPNKDKDKFNKALETHIEKNSCNFRFIVFPGDANFESITFSQEADFAAARFRGNVNFFKATFSEGASFANAEFLKVADFGSSVFTKGAFFELSKFRDDAHFENATFTAKSHFTSSKFEGDANFSEAAFLKESDFSDVVFVGSADFYQAKFNDYANFFGTKFIKDAVFDKTTFMKVARFECAKLNDRALFRETQFTERANFGFSEMAGQTDYSFANFKRDADFNRAIFHSLTRFKGTIFTSKANFSEAIFYGRTIFASYKKDAASPQIFHDACVDFKGVIIQPPDILSFVDADLRKCSFIGTDVRKVEFTGSDWPLITWPEKIAKDCGCLKSKRIGVYDEESLKAKPYLVPHIERLYRELKQNYEDRRDFDRAGDFHYGEKQMRSKNPLTPLNRRVPLWLYWLVSGYGERCFRPLLGVVALMMICAVMYCYLGLQLNDSGPRKRCSDFYECTNYSFRVMSHLKTDYWRPPKGGAMYVNTVQSILGPILIGLFALALRQRLKR